MVEAFEAVLPQSILAKLEPFSFAICCKDGGYAICLQSLKALSDDVYHGPLTKYIDKNNWFGFVDDVKSKPEYKARLAELHVPAAIAPEIELLELHEQWNDHNKYVIDKFIRFDAVYYIPLHDTTIPSIIKAAKIFAGYGNWQNWPSTRKEVVLEESQEWLASFFVFCNDDATPAKPVELSKA